MKKIVSVLASIMALAVGSAAMAVTASAETGVAFEVGTVSTAGAIADGKLVQEELVLLPVKITENQGVTAFLLQFTQDSNIEVTSAKTRGLDYSQSGAFTWNVNNRCLLWSENACQDTTVCGTVVNLEIKIPAGTPEGRYEIGFEESGIQVTNTNFDSMEYTLTAGYVEVGGGNASQNPPPVVTEAPVTQAPKPAVVTKAPVKATQPPVTSAVEPDVTKAGDGTAENAAGAAENQQTVTAAVSDVTVTAVSGSEETTDTDSTAVTGSAVVSGTDETTTTKAVSPSNNSKNNKSSSSANKKTSDSPSTGVAGVAVPAALLAVSIAGIAASKKKN